MTICNDTKASSRFYAPFLTILFPYYIFVPCYLLKLVLFPGDIPFSDTYIYLLVWIVFTASIMVVIHYCAGIVRKFDKILIENRRFFFEVQRKGRKMGRVIPAKNLLLLEGNQLSHRFVKYSFKLHGINYRITSKTFNAVKQ